jgi:Mn2+/Fe2+ NRAMP family transporter
VSSWKTGRSRGWKCGLEHKPWEAVRFYAVIGLATLLGIAIDWSPLDPIKALFYSAVINGFVAVPIMAAMMLVVSRFSTMGKFTARPRSLFFGWTATFVMGAAAIAMLLIQ